MMRNLFFKSSLIIVGVLLAVNCVHAQTALYPKQGDYRAIKDGSWGNPDTWVRWHNSRGWQEGLYDYIAPPGRLSTVVIAAGVTVTIDDGALIGTWLSAMRNGGEGRYVEYPYSCSKLILEPGAKIVSAADHNLVAGSVQYVHPFDGQTFTNSWDSGGYTLRIQGDSILNNGTIGVVNEDGIILEMGAPFVQGSSTVYTNGFKLVGAGTTTISKFRMAGGHKNPADIIPGTTKTEVSIGQNMSVGGAGYAFTALWKQWRSDNYILRVLPGYTVSLTNPDGEIHYQALKTANTVDTGGNYTYKIEGTLDASASFKTMRFTKLASASSNITVDATCPGKVITQFPLSINTVSNSLGNVYFLPATGGCYEVLPLDILTFTAKLNEGIKNEVLLNWSTTNERNTRAFIVERSNDGKDFKTIGTVNAANTSGVHSYSFTDADPFVGTSYYRLKQIDIDGKHKFSAIQSVNARSKAGIVAFPNPAKDRLTVVFGSLANSAARIDILAADGKLMKSTNIATGVTQTTLDVSGLQKGYYMVRVQYGSEQTILKFFKN